MEPESSNDNAEVAARHNSATTSSINWLTSPLYFAGVRVTVVGMVVVVIEWLASVTELRRSASLVSDTAALSRVKRCLIVFSLES
jgi:hypothetical protein